MLKAAKRRVLEKAFSRFYAWRLEQFTDDRVITLDYPVRPAPRYTPGHRAHPELWSWFDGQRSACADALDAVSRCREALERIPRARADQNTPYWDNIFFSALDAMALYSIIATRRPAHIVEVGSGNSTKFARQAIRDAGCETTLASIDPQPRAEIDALCSQVLRQPLEQVDQRVFAALSRGDVLFIDSSHRAFTNSDVTTFFLEILPRLASGVIVHIHDIFLPWDYPVEWNARYYSEQYLMASWLLAGPERCRLLLSNAFTSYDPQLRRTFANLLAGSPLAFMADPDFQYGGIRGLAGVSLWVEVA
jgi:hypothetical protein